MNRFSPLYIRALLSLGTLSLLIPLGAELSNGQKRGAMTKACHVGFQTVDGQFGASQVQPLPSAPNERQTADGFALGSFLVCGNLYSQALAAGIIKIRPRVKPKRILAPSA